MRFLLEKTVDNEDIFKTMLDNLKIVSKLITKHRVTDVFLESCPNIIHDKQELKAALTGLYNKILTFLARAIEYVEKTRKQSRKKTNKDILILPWINMRNIDMS